MINAQIANMMSNREADLDLNFKSGYDEQMEKFRIDVEKANISIALLQTIKYKETSFNYTVSTNDAEKIVKWIETYNFAVTMEEMPFNKAKTILTIDFSDSVIEKIVEKAGQFNLCEFSNESMD